MAGLAGLCAPALAQDDGETVLPAITVTAPGGVSQAPAGQLPATVVSSSGERTAQTVNATDAQDALKYLPSLSVRKRHIGDYDHAVLASRSSGSGNSARSLVFVDGIPIANLLGNGAFYTPRWGVLNAAAIERVDVLYGPFSARYSGNSLGAVVEYQTRMPQHWQAEAGAQWWTQPYALYGTDSHYPGGQLHASLGNRHGAWAWTLGLQHLDSRSQPAAFATRLLSTGNAGLTGTPVSGAVAGHNAQGQPWLLLGSTHQINSVQDLLRWRLSHSFASGVEASWTAAGWFNEVARDSSSWLRDANGNPVTRGTISIDGLGWTLQPSDFAATRARLEHWMHGLTLGHQGQGTLDWQLRASVYDYARDEQRTQTDFEADGAGRLNDQGGSGWRLLAGQLNWYPQGRGGAHGLELGWQWQAFRLQQQLRDIDSGWSHAEAEQLFSLFNGRTALYGMYGQHDWRFAPDWRLVSGLRMEQWWAGDGQIGNASSGVIERELTRREWYASPKLMLSWQTRPDWLLRLNLGRAVRTPTVTELFQGTVEAGTDPDGPAWVIRNSNGQLQPERSWASELASHWQFDSGDLRLSLFHEITHDALYSQPAPPGSGATIRNTVQNIDRVDTLGLELAGTREDWLLSGLHVDGSLTWADSEIVRNAAYPQSEGRRQPRVPRWRATALLRWEASERWSASLGARYSGRQYGQLDNSDSHGDAYMGFSSWLVLDARLRMKLAARWTAAVGIDNLNNEQYWAFHPYPQRTLLAELRYGR